jgi:hypothetical protein
MRSRLARVTPIHLQADADRFPFGGVETIMLVNQCGNGPPSFH